jgi:hypothetical protein
VSTESVTVTIRNAGLADEMGAAEWDDQPVLICASKAALASMLDDAGVDVTAPVKADVETAVATFRQFAALSVEDAAPHDEDGDGILAQSERTTSVVSVSSQLILRDNSERPALKTCRCGS